MSGIASGEIIVVRDEKWLVRHATYAEFSRRLGL